MALDGVVEAVKKVSASRVSVYVECKWDDG